MNIDENRLKVVYEIFGKLGFELIHVGGHKNNNGPDLWVKKPAGRPLSVELKYVKKNKTTGAYSVEPVSEARTGDDLIAIFINDLYLLIEPMQDHLKCCGPSGYRPITIIPGENP